MTDHVCLRRLVFAATVVLYAVPPQIAWSQALPWQTGSGQSSTSSSAPQPHRHHHNGKGAPGSTHEYSSHTRAQDDRELDALATRFYAIHENDNDAVKKLAALEHKVAAFQTSLRHTDYEAGDIRKDAANLHYRIERQRKEWEAKSGVSETPAASNMKVVTMPAKTSAPAAPPAPTAAPAPVAIPVPPAPPVTR